MRFTILPALLLVALVVPNLHAQSNQLEQSQMAAISFEINLEKIYNSEMSKTLELASKIESAAPKSDSFDAASIKRAFGAVSAPESMQEVQEWYKGEGPLSVEFFTRVELVDSAATEKAMKQIQENNEVVEIDGKTFYKSTKDDAPEGVLVHRVDDSTIEMGTEAYLLRADRKVFTDGLTAAWKKAPDEAVKIAMDFEGAASLVDELQEMAAARIPANFAAYAELIGGISGMHVTIDLEGKNLLSVGMSGRSESEAVNIEDGLGSLISIGQMAGMGQVGQLKQISPELGGAVEQMLQALNASREGNDVSVNLIHPEGLANAIKGLIGG